MYITIVYGRMANDDLTSECDGERDEQNKTPFDTRNTIPKL